MLLFRTDRRMDGLDRDQHPLSLSASRENYLQQTEASSLAIDSASTASLTPNTASTSSIPKTKKSNPLNDLIDTEKQYVEQLTGVIRKVAAAWSRSNLPPPDLDVMFRSIEAVYRANRSLYSRNSKTLEQTRHHPKPLEIF